MGGPDGGRELPTFMGGGGFARVEHFLESVRRTGDWRCGSLPGIDSPGLMTGLAGAGYALLRIAAPERVPSLLALDAPMSRPDTDRQKQP